MRNTFHLCKAGLENKQGGKDDKKHNCLNDPFHSFTLFFTEDIVNFKYNKINVKVYLSITCFVLSFLYSLVTFVLIVISSQKEPHEIVSTFAFGINVLFMVIYILLHVKSNIFKCKDKKFIELIVLYEQYVMITLTNCFLKHYLKRYSNYDPRCISISFLMVDLFFKYIWLLTSLNEFIMVFCGNIISLLIIVPFYSIDHKHYNTEVNLFIITTTVMLIFHTVISYYVTKAGKLVYFLRALSQSGFELLNVINTGYVSFSYDGGINYFNSFFDNDSFHNTFNLLQASKEDFIYNLINGRFDSVNEETWNSIHNAFSTTYNSQGTNKTGNSFMNYLNDCKSANVINRENQNEKITIGIPESRSDDHHSSNKNNDKNNESHQVLDFYTQLPKEPLIKLIINYLKNNKDIYNEFTYLGQKKIVNEKERKVISLNMFFKHNTSNHSIEFIFNDESKINYQFLFNTFVQQISEYLHDFKNPLICLNSELTEIQDIFINLQNDNKTQFAFDDAFISKLDFLTTTTNDCTDMIKSFGSYAKNILGNTEEIELKMATFDLGDLVTYLRYWMNIQIFRSQKTIEFNVDYQLEDPLQFYSDKLKLKQVLINILSNSFKFTSNGSIMLRLTREVFDMKQYIKFEIEDTGVGMDENIQKNIFQPFASYNPDNMNKDGCGLGLVISKKITEKLGKGLDIVSYPKKGTKMWFYCEERNIHPCSNNCSSANVTKPQHRLSTSNSNINQGDLMGIKGLNGVVNVHPIQKNSNNNSNSNSSNSNSNSNGIGNISRTNSALHNNPNYPDSPNHPRLRRKSRTSKLNVIREESSRKFDNNNNNNYNDTICCEDPLQISPFEKSEYLTSPSPKRKKKNKLSLDIVCSSMLQDEFELLDNNEANPIRKLWSRIGHKSKNLFMNLCICYNDPLSYLSILTQKEKTMNMLLRSGTMNIKEPIYLGRQQRNITDSNSLIQSQISTSSPCAILVVDDNESIRKSIKRLINELVKTIVVEEASDGLDVLELFLKRKTVVYEWIIIDNEMTYLDGMNVIIALEYFLQSSFSDKCKFDSTILKRVVMCTANEDGVKDQLTNKAIKICPKPLEKAYLKELLSNKL